MYNPDHIEQAKKDILEQRRFETTEQELAVELNHVKAFVQSHSEVSAMENITKQQRLEHLPALLVENGVAYKVIKRDVYRDEGDEKIYWAEYAPLDDQDEAMRLHELAEITLHHDPKDRNKWKYYKWLDESDEEVKLPVDAALYYTFRRGVNEIELYKANERWYIVSELHRMKSCYSLSLSNEAQDKEGVFCLDFAVECAIEADKQFIESKKAYRKLREMAGDAGVMLDKWFDK